MDWAGGLWGVRFTRGKSKGDIRTLNISIKRLEFSPGWCGSVD